MKIHYIEIPQEVTNIIERMNYEYTTLQDNISFMIQHYHDKEVLNNEVFIEYQQNEIKLKEAIDKFLVSLKEKYIPKAFNEHKYNYEVEFAKSAIKITQFCNCEIEFSIGENKNETV